MIREYFATVALILLASAAIAQQTTLDDIISVEDRKPGVYRTFKEFRANSPGLTGTLKVTRNRVRILNEISGRYEAVKGEFWGSCVNDSIYVFLKETATAQSPHLYPLEFIGRYCYFVDTGAYTQMTGGGTYTGGYLAQYIVNINNGVIYKLDKKIMRTLLEKDSDLLQEFENESSKQEVFRDYIIKINQRRAGDIKAVN